MYSYKTWPGRVFSVLTFIGKLEAIHHDVLVESEEQECPKQHTEEDSDNGCHKPHNPIVQEDKV